MGVLLNRANETHFRVMVRELGSGNDDQLRRTASQLSQAFVRGGWLELTQQLGTLSDPDRSTLLLVIGAEGERYWAPPEAQVQTEQRSDGSLRINFADPLRGGEFVILEKLANAEPIAPGGKTIGHLLRLPMGRPPLSQPHRNFLNQSKASLMAMIGSFVVAGLLIVYVLGRRITRPLQQLSSATQRISGGDLGYQVPVEGSDEVAQLARQFNAMSQKLERTERLRKTMVSDIAHELRTPLTGMRCTLESIRDGLIEASDEQVETLYAEIAELSQLVADLQELSLADAHEINLELTTVSLRQAIDSALGAIPFELRGIRCRLQPEGSLVNVYADARRLRQVLINLLQNALAHSPPNATVTIDCQWDQSEASVSICDQGPGVASAELENIFERHYRADNARSRDTGGSGLGLAISRQLVQLMGGQLSAHLPEDGGMELLLRLPRLTIANDAGDNHLRTTSR